MIRLAGGSIARDFAINVRTAGAGLLHLFENEEPCAFRQNEAIAIARKGPGGALRIVIPVRAHDAHELKAAQDERRDGRIDAPRHHRLHDAHLDVPEGVTQRVGGGRTASRNDVAHAAQAETHGDFAGKRANSASRNGVDAALLLVAVVVEAVLLFGEILAAAARANDYADFA